MRGGRAVEDNETVAPLRVEINPTRPLRLIHAGCGYVDETGITGVGDAVGRLRSGTVVADGNVVVERPGEFRFSQRYCDSPRPGEFRNGENECCRSGQGMVFVRGLDDGSRTPGDGDGPIIHLGGNAGGTSANTRKRNGGTLELVLHLVLRAAGDGAGGRG